MNSIRIEGILYHKGDILGDHPPVFAARSPHHHALYLFLREWFSSSPTLTLHTSGSTGTPKEIMVRKEQMIESARITRDFFQLKKDDNALLCLPLDYIAGKMMVVRALYAGLDLWPVEPSGHPLKQISRPVDFAAMVPLQVYNSLKTKGEKNRLSRIGRLIIGGGVIDPSLEEALKEFPNEVYSTYGMTETVSHIALRKINGSEAEEFYTPLENVSVRLSEEDTLVIDAPCVADEILFTNDIAQLKPDNTFRILGRKDNVINTGGIKVQIEEVERLLRPHVTGNFVITSVPHPKLGEAVVLLIEPTADPVAVKKAVEQLLPRYQQPLHILTVDAIPLTRSGKIDRSAAKRIASEKSSTDFLS